jgi:hypothetical protein
MHEIEKIKEAEYFYNQMLRTEDDSDAFKYNLSAFLAATRSVLQFAFSEAKAKSGGQQWYDSIIAGKPILLFFKDKRDVNIHREPVRVRKDIHILITENISISESITIVQKDEHGNVIGESKSETAPPKAKEEIPAEITYKYMFDDWTGIEDVLGLCQRYLIELKVIVADGRKKGFLS